MQSTSDEPQQQQQHQSLSLQQQQRGALAKVKSGTATSGGGGVGGVVERRGRQTTHTQSSTSAKTPRELKAAASKEPLPGDTR